ncbi:hypothetical protein H1Q59_05635 [Holosporaceae bacterium 'Namur']|nr:hypothetical protein [Holosporaceae bacterium 'Namur']
MRNINYESEERQNIFPLHYCLGAQKSDYVKQILEILQNQIKDRNEFINRKDEYGYTPMHIFAVCNGQSPQYIVNAQYLKEQGADLNAKDNEGNTPLHLWAKRNGELSEQMTNSPIELIREAPEYHIKFSMPFLGWMLLNGYDTNARNHNGFTALGLLKQVTPTANIDEDTLKRAYINWEKTERYRNSNHTNEQEKGCCIMM